MTSLRLLDGGNAAFPRMLAELAAARSTVWLEIYTFRADRTGEQFIHALTGAAARGVKVTVIIDGWGSVGGARDLVTRLAAHGVQARIYHRLRDVLGGRFRRNHRKVLVVDDRIAFLGGINIGDEYAGPEAWADLAVEITGPLARWLGLKLRGDPAGPQSAQSHVSLSGENGGRRLRSRYLKAISRAQKSLWVANAYFLPDAQLLKALMRAARRGVDVQLLLPGKSDVPLARAGSVRLYRQLLDAGVHIHEWRRTVLHAKCAVVDSDFALLGSFNLDPLSLVNLETLIELREPEVCAEVEAWFRSHLAESVTIGLGERPWLERVLTGWLGEWAARIAGWTARQLARGTPRWRRTAAEPFARLPPKTPPG